MYVCVKLKPTKGPQRRAYHRQLPLTIMCLDGSGTEIHRLPVFSLYAKFSGSRSNSLCVAHLQYMLMQKLDTVAPSLRWGWKIEPKIIRLWIRFFHFFHKNDLVHKLLE